MKTFRLQLRFLVPLVVILAAAAYLALPLMDRLTLRWFARDLNMRGTLVTNALSESIADALPEPRGRKLQALFNRAMQDERLVAIGLCSTDRKLLRTTPNFPKDLDCERAEQIAAEPDPLLRIGGGPVHVGVHPVNAEAGRVGDLVLLQDLSFIERRSQDTRQYLIILIASLGAVIALVTVIVAQLSWRGWVSGTRALLRGEGLIRPLARHRARTRTAGRRPAGPPARTRGRIPPLAGAGSRLEPRAAAIPAAHAIQRRPGHRGIQPRAVYPRTQRRRHRGAPARQRPGHRGRAGDAGLLRHLDRPRQRQRRPGCGRRP